MKIERKEPKTPPIAFKIPKGWTITLKRSGAGEEGWQEYNDGNGEEYVVCDSGYLRIMDRAEFETFYKAAITPEEVIDESYR